MITNVAVRWRDQVGSYRPANEQFDPNEYEVAPIASDKLAKAFVEQHHYSGSYPAARFRYGLYHRSGELHGVAVYSVPPHNAVLTNVFPCDAMEATELGRFVLLDKAKGNAETWFLARTFSNLRQSGIIGVVSHSDPMARTNVDGTVTFKGHVGGIYQAHNARYIGRLRSRPLLVLPNGTVFSDRAASKIRNMERGWRYAIDQLVEAGAPAPENMTDLRAWLNEMLPSITRREKHPGNLKYAWGLTHGMRKHIGPANPADYVKLDVPRDCVRVAA